MTEITRINTRDELAQVARDLRVRPDWHEPDEQGISARVVGDHLDNAMGPNAEEDRNFGEYNVVITREDDEGNPQDFAVVNLATLLAFATGTYEG